MGKVEIAAKVIIAVVLMIAIFFSSYLQSLLYKSILAGIVGVVAYFSPDVLDKINKYKKSEEQLTIIKNNLYSLNKFTEKYLNKSININAEAQRIKDSGTQYRKIDFIYEALKGLFQNNVKHDAVFLTVLCNESDKESNPAEISLYKQRISEILEKYDFAHLNEDSKMILKYFYNYENDKSLEEDAESIDNKEVFDRLTKKYCRSLNIAFHMALEKDQAEEFRKTLAILIGRGKLSLKQLKKDVITRMNKEIEKKQKTAQAYLLLANKFHYIPEVVASIEKFPNIKIGTKYAIGLPEAVKYLHMRIVYPTDNYKDAGDFLKKEILPNIPKSKINDGFIAIIPIEGTEIYSYPVRKDEIKDAKVKESFESVSAIKTGMPYVMADLLVNDLDADVPIEDILSIIPFNIFVPDISQRARNFIIDNYEKIKREFSVNTLFDWADVRQAALGRKLISLDKGSGSRKRVAKDETWNMTARKVVEEAKKHRNAVDARE